MSTIAIRKRPSIIFLLYFVGLIAFLFYALPSWSGTQRIDAYAANNAGFGRVNLRAHLRNENNLDRLLGANESALDQSSSGNTTDNDGHRRAFIKSMLLHAWRGYRKFAWGANEVRPISKIPHSQEIFGSSRSHLGATIVDAIDTLLIMGLKNEYEEARQFVEKEFDISSVDGTISVFETTIRFVGGFLSAYALTNNKLYLTKARDVATVLLKAFETKTGIPMSMVNPSSGSINNYHWASSYSSVLAEIGSLHLEFYYLSRITGDSVFEKKVQRVRDYLENITKIEGLYPNFISPETGEWTSHHVSLGAMGDSFYEYLLKSYLQTNKTNEQPWRMYKATIDAIIEKMVQKSVGGLTYIAEWRDGNLEHKMGHLACFTVGMFALQAVNENNRSRSRRVMKLAEELGRTCHESYIRTATRIGPEMFYFSVDHEATTLMDGRGYILRPEVIEGFFYLWRLTGKPMYKEWIWDAIIAIEKYCKTEGGYAGLVNVYNPAEGYDDVQQSFFLAETLKYAYLAFNDNTVISLDEWVFNTEAHPLPILKDL
ncbi:hypothetical protein AB6A40_004316 [Gnathostoma spinigerum]|uniref:alpha-1,2-Mannosidase n=1 Tax=Gnathostoma spinigerum TaxID=75299 RepID=A0ABD6EEA6_9BILA